MEPSVNGTLLLSSFNCFLDYQDDNQNDTAADSNTTDGCANEGHNGTDPGSQEDTRYSQDGKSHPFEECHHG